ncbi:ATP-dependent protease ATPase subunit HslU [Acrasis kona]|uniref:ATP-dependent protease ATPase subunit HslU n=1 Tax=Acrasis kona TaxID=1008807 RepID=A0AAW2ZK09_9EUKA
MLSRTRKPPKVPRNDSQVNVSKKKDYTPKKKKTKVPEPVEQLKTEPKHEGSLRTNALLETYREKLLEAEAYVAKLDQQILKASADYQSKVEHDEKPSRKQKKQQKPTIDSARRKSQSEIEANITEIETPRKRTSLNMNNDDKELVQKLIHNFKKQMDEQQSLFLNDIKQLMNGSNLNGSVTSRQSVRKDSLDSLERNIDRQQSEMNYKFHKRRRDVKYESDSDKSDYEQVEGSEVATSSSFLKRLTSSKSPYRSVDSTFRTSIPNLPNIFNNSRPMEVSTEWIPV